MIPLNFHMLEERRFQLFVVVLAGLLAFCVTLGNGYVWDDSVYLKGNRFIESFDILAMLTSPATGVEYNPLRDISIAADYFLWKENYLGYHLTSLIIHIVASVLFYLVAAELVSGESRKQEPDAQSLFPLVSALLFAVHPIQTQSVSFVMARNSLFAGLFSVLTLLLYLKFLNTGNRRIYCLALAATLLAVLSKATAIILPGLIGVVILYRRYRRPLAGHLADMAPFCAISAIFYFVYRGVAANAAILNVQPAVGLSAKIAVAVQIPWFYLFKFIVPFGYSPEYVTEFKTSLHAPGVLGAIAGYLVFAALAWQFRKRIPLLSVGLCWYMVALLPVMNFFSTHPVVADRYTYLPLFGLSLAASAGAIGLAGNKPKKSFLFIVALVAAGLIILSCRESLVWQSDKTLWERGIEREPNLGKAYINLGGYYYNRKEYDKAFALFDRARSTTFPKDYYEYYKAVLLIDAGDYGRAEEHLKKALARYEFPEALYRLGFVYERLGNTESALQSYLRAKEMHGQDEYKVISRSREAYDRLSASLMPAIEAARKQVEASPSDIRKRGELALRLDRLTFYNDALAEYRNLERLGMNSWELQYNIGNLCSKLKRYDEAALAYRKSIAMNRANSDAYNNLGSVLKEKGEYSQALDAFKQAVALDNRFAQSWFNMAATYHKMGNYVDAQKIAQKLAAEYPEMKTRVAQFLVP